MIRNKIVLVLVVAMIGIVAMGCKKQYVQYYAVNASSDTVVIEYYPVGTTDTTIVQMLPHSGYPPQYRFTFHSIDPDGDDWTSTYEIYISYIKNTFGVPVNFDPNAEGNWKFNQYQNYHNYHLTIDENSF